MATFAVVQLIRRVRSVCSRKLSIINANLSSQFGDRMTSCVCASGGRQRLDESGISSAPGATCGWHHSVWRRLFQVCQNDTIGTRGTRKEELSTRPLHLHHPERVRTGEPSVFFYLCWTGQAKLFFCQSHMAMTLRCLRYGVFTLPVVLLPRVRADCFSEGNEDCERPRSEERSKKPLRQPLS